MSKLPKNFLIFVLVYLVFAIWNLKFPPKASAQVPPPTVPCDQTQDPEFHSLRPYQASPCKKDVSETALLCGNDLIAVKKYEVQPNSSCQTNQNGSITCNYSFSESVRTTIDVSKAKLPIMGNTEDVPNSQSQTNGLDNAERTNQYVSWYLNGVTGRAEEAYLDAGNPQDASTIVNFSGPLKKLLPFSIQMKERIKTIKNAGDNRHDQVVACTYGVNVLGHEIGGIPGPCYSPPLGVTSIVQKHRLSDWLGNLPPLEENFTQFEDWWKAYQNWRGKFCPQIEVFGKKINLFCGLENPLSPNFYANLFSYVPFSSTEDRKGDAFTTDFSNQNQDFGDEVKITNLSYRADNSKNILYFPHMEETNDLAALLQKTYVSAGESGNSGLKPNIAVPANCDFATSRGNPGDSLFGNYQNSPITGNLSYNVSFSCTFTPTFDQDVYNACIVKGGSVLQCRKEATKSGKCTKETHAAVSLYNNTPKADEVWDRLVKGSQSVFKRFFPSDLIQGDSIKDIPGVTNVKYSSSANETLAGNPANQRPGENAEFYIPHVGGIYEYFLKGIQTALRPKGYGSLITGISAATREINCNKDAPDPGRVSGLLSKETMVKEFENEFPGNHIADCYNDIVGKARKAGYDPAFAIAIWIEESGASAYSDFGEVADMGCAVNTPRNDFNAQTECFFNLRGFYQSADIFKDCRVSLGRLTMDDFLLIFSEGGGKACTKGNSCYRKYCTNPDFPQRIRDYYRRVSGGRTLPPFP